MPKNIHDKTFAELLSQRTFFEGFLRNYLPDEIKKAVQWETLKLYKINGRHIQEKTQQISIADVIYLCQIDQQENMLWVHVEHQSTPDRLMPLRIINYQTGELLSYAKTHKNKKFPPIISFIYFQGESAYPYSLSLESLFEDSELGLKYFGRPVLINLPAIPDEKLREHSDIGAIEILLKHIRRRDFTHNYRVVIAGLQQVKDDVRRTMLKYLIERSDIPREELFNTILEYLPKEESDMATVAEQLRHEGRQQGLQQGMQEGKLEAANKIARKLLLGGWSVAEVAKVTELSAEEIVLLQKQIR